MDLLAWMEQWHMLPEKGGVILCAVSGGRDSVCLLHYLHAISAQCGFSVAAGHYNHHMRPTAQRDEDFVRNLCAELNVPFYTDGSDVCAAAKERRLGVEETGRQLRYAFLEQLADRIGAAKIATAHHREDQAETVLLQLLRGTGPEGLGGIPPVRGRLIRPLLQTSRQEIEDYLDAHGLSHVEDETNESLAFARNRLRKTVMPELEKIHPALRQNIARTAQIVRKENAYLDELALQHLPPEGTEISCKDLLCAPEVLRPRMVRQLLARLATGKKDIGAVHVEEILCAVQRGGESMTALPENAAAIVRDGRLRLCVLPNSAPRTRLQEGCTLWGDWCVTLRRKKADERQIPHAIYLSCDTMEKAVEVDTCAAAERLTLPGSRGGRSVKRLLTERGVPPEERLLSPCIRVDGQLAAVHGVGTDENFLPEETDEQIVITFKER